MPIDVLLYSLADSLQEIKNSYTGSKGDKLTIEADDTVGHEEHEEDDDNPAEDLCHPSSMVDLVAGVLLVLYPGHDDGEDGEEEEVAEADPEHRVGLEPLAVRRLVEVVNPCGNREKRDKSPTKLPINRAKSPPNRTQSRRGFPRHAHGIDWRSGAATSRSAQEAKRESAKRPQ
jgi:hypothetical protein